MAHRVTEKSERLGSLFIPHPKIKKGEGLKMKKVGILLLASAFVLFTILPCSAKVAQAATSIKIGTILDFTGPMAFLGPLLKNGMVKALEEVDYTVAGKKIELIAEDTANDMNVCLEKAKKLVELDKVHIILGPLMGDAQMAIAPYLASKKILGVTPYSGSIELHTKFKNWLNYPTTLVGMTLPLGYYAAELGYKEMITLGGDYEGGRGFIQGIKMGFEEKGGKVIQQIWAPVGTSDYGPYLSTLKKADCLAYFVPSPPEQVRLLKQRTEFGINIPVLGTILTGQLVAPILAELGDIAVGLQGQSIYVPSRKDPMNERWVADMTRRFGQGPGDFESNAYAITQAVLAGLKATNGDDSFKKFWPAVLKVHIDTPQGPLAFSPEGVAITNIYIVEVKKKEGKYYFDIVKTYEKVVDPRLKKK
jgi:branched-chain amino acid transport system substrate-binding protein